MDILSDVNIVGYIKTTGGANIGGSLSIGSNLFFHSPISGNGRVDLLTAYNKNGSTNIDNKASIIFKRKSNGTPLMYLAICGEAVVCGTLKTNSFSYFCKTIYVNSGMSINCLNNYHSGKIKNSFFDSNHVFGETMTIDVPADCTRFFIGDIQVGHTDADFDFRTVDCLADYFVYPTISVYRDNKKVDMDIEVDTINFPSGNEGSSANNSFTEVIIGNIKACSSNQQFKVAISPTFQFDY